MGTLQQGNGLGILSILVIIFRSGYNFYILWENYYNEYLWLEENGNFITDIKTKDV